ncbi:MULTISPECIES: transglutaminase family protein [unclassified Mesorhizobium]|uniref:transglutaminase family protein n=1 Tax=unclassified Mesorhizobium TaxID=325217 RepID=UPI000F74D35F|nr:MULTISPECIES: transglutaminase family protein [unclassified Mesorhizobium]AZO22024.1 transglutaminase family protein [Mesorhizobium sp. M1E.F.Ca.ET.045.02.1.1]RUW37322.1 transglutaminase family protein [Mesorhizobium sp. M1E.F.Ca.ET.041.01.1.1]RUW82610.1 transglutaminase family protein [Mesorhizobium sp. M1E.F.Ca.ET.063.01.1.1]RWB61618.1 MAG: transglutaminase family protein [Mesorhizobium sp.]RWD86900.1 MAG: transglutaminase family protein [Mesorhizobium sp.]
MLYDIRLHLHYEYASAAGGGRHQVRVLPQTIAGVQRVIAASLSFQPMPSERADFSDFFGNNVTSIAFREAHEELDIRMSARVSVSRPEPGLDVSPDIHGLRAELDAVRSLSPAAPHHFLAASDYAGLDAAITAYARESLSGSTVGTAVDLCNRIHRDFTYDGKATTVQTRGSDAFALKRGVCQDFSHIMIAGLRGLGIPAGYVSGFLRTIPPKGKPRLEGADAMHAWVKVWCGRDAGWQEFDPTNGMRASNDHITVGHGRDYSDVAPIVGVLKTTGGQVGEQAVDVIPVAA